jgi:hypothetical protein
MYATAERPMTGGAGWVRLNPIEVNEVMDILALRSETDSNGRSRDYWLVKVMRSSAFAEMPPVPAMELMQAIAANDELRHSRKYLAEAVRDAIEGEGL